MGKQQITMIKNFSTLLLSSLILLTYSCASLSEDLVREDTELQPVEQIKEKQHNGQVLPITAQAIFKGKKINLEVATTAQEQSMGLMFRPELPADRGMLFPFRRARIARFWMNNVPVSLDMIFIRQGKIIAIANSVPPCTTKPEDCPLYGPDVPVDSVLELRAGRAAELELEVGNEVILEKL